MPRWDCVHYYALGNLIHRSTQCLIPEPGECPPRWFGATVAASEFVGHYKYATNFKVDGRGP
jgi:hypothetical protein